jgi:hypothetical protein
VVKRGCQNAWGSRDHRTTEEWAKKNVRGGGSGVKERRESIVNRKMKGRSWRRLLRQPQVLLALSSYLFSSNCNLLLNFCNWLFMWPLKFSKKSFN